MNTTRMRLTGLTAGALTVAALTLTACSSSGTSHAHHASSSTATSTATAGQHVTLHATDQLRFQPATITVHTGIVRVTLVDDGSYPHNLSVPSLHVTSATVTGSPGEQSSTVTLRFSHAGSYPFECTFHVAAGMRGRFVVRP